MCVRESVCVACQLRHVCIRLLWRQVVRPLDTTERRLMERKKGDSCCDGESENTEDESALELGDWRIEFTHRFSTDYATRKVECFSRKVDSVNTVSVLLSSVAK